MIKQRQAYSLKSATSDQNQIDKIKNLLTGLGKATKRGIRKCPHCGTINGTRGITCKNKNCNRMLKDRGKILKREKSADAVKLVAGINNQVFSVRIKDKGLNHRGIVVLPIIHDSEGQAVNYTDLNIDQQLLVKYAQCHVINCPRAIENEETINLSCLHIKSALQCKLFAESLQFKSHILEKLPIDYDTKQAIYSLSNSSAGPLVQRVSKTTMIVKCRLSNDFPLGLLHIQFSEVSDNKPDLKYLCACTNTKSSIKTIDEQPRCLHVLACVVAFLSSEKLEQEFEHNIKSILSCQAEFLPVLLDNDEQNQEFFNDVNIIDDVNISGQILDEKNESNTFELIIGDHDNNQIINVHNVDSETEIISEAMDLEESCKQSESELNQVLVEEDDCDDVDEFKNMQYNSSYKPTMLSILPPERKPIEIKASKGIPSKMLTLQTSTLNTASVLKESHFNYYADKQIVPPPNMSQNDDAHITFTQWLSNITEQINYTMHYANIGKPEPLFFQVPQVFFDCLQQRISIGNKKRLPNKTTIITKTDSTPMGTFTKFTWHIHNILHVKCIFDTPQVLLEISRNFIEKPNGSFVHMSNIQEQLNQKRKKNVHNLDLKTFLKVGFTDSEQKESNPFIIEWIPDYYPKSKMGQMSLQFQFGHMRYGVVEKTFNKRNVRIAIKS